MRSGGRGYRAAPRSSAPIGFGIALALLALALLATPAPGSTSDEKGPSIRQASRVFGPYDLQAAGLAQAFQPVMIDFPEPVWVLAYRTEIVDATGSTLPDDLHCHTMLKTGYTESWRQWIGSGSDTLPFRGLYTDGHTTEVRMPAGYGVYYAAGEAIMLQPMFNNREPAAFAAGMRVTLEYVLDSELEQKLTPLYATLQSVKPPPHLYYVPPGIDVKETEFRFPYDGTIHAMAVHVHPYGETVELVNVDRDELVWRAQGERRADGTLISMPVYGSRDGYRFRSDETYRLRVRYDNPTAVEQDAMGGLFFFFSTTDGELPQPPSTPPPQPSAPADPAHHHHR